jgi:hypothetical protein
MQFAGSEIGYNLMNKDFFEALKNDEKRNDNGIG